jgi:S-adenosyl methyltransferase
VDRPLWAPTDVDITRPSVARVYDYYLGGSHNFESDRAFGRRVVDVYPALPIVLRENRAFLRRVVRHLVGAGVDQFLDLGSGIPTVGNVHEVAHAVNPAARIVYVDHDPVAVTHSRELLSGDPRTPVVAADLLDPEHVLAQAVAVGGLDLRRPVAVLALMVLHFVPEERRPAEVMAHYLRDVAPGSHLVISHTRLDGVPEAVAGQRLYARERSLAPMHPRTAAEVMALFGGLTLLPPGVVAAPAWRPDPAEAVEVPDDYPVLAGMARRD